MYGAKKTRLSVVFSAAVLILHRQAVGTEFPAGAGVVPAGLLGLLYRLLLHRGVAPALAAAFFETLLRSSVSSFFTRTMKDAGRSPCGCR